MKLTLFHQALLAHNAKVYIAARNKEKTEPVIQKLKEETKNEPIFLKLDLGDLKSIKASAEEFLRYDIPAVACWRSMH